MRYRLHLQLKRGSSEGTSLSTANVISKIVRLTVETNLVTSKRILTPVRCRVSSFSFSNRGNHGISIVRCNYFPVWNRTRA